MIEVTPSESSPESILYVIATFLLIAGVVLVFVAVQTMQPTPAERAAAALGTTVEELGGHGDSGRQVIFGWMLFFGGLASCLGGLVSFGFGRVVAAIRQ
jgi:hypothetical protein